MQRRIIVQFDDADKRTCEKLVDAMYELLYGRGLDYGVWVESYKSEKLAAGGSHIRKTD